MKRKFYAELEKIEAEWEKALSEAGYTVENIEAWGVVSGDGHGMNKKGEVKIRYEGFSEEKSGKNIPQPDAFAPGDFNVLANGKPVVKKTASMKKIKGKSFRIQSTVFKVGDDGAYYFAGAKTEIDPNEFVTILGRKSKR